MNVESAKGSTVLPGIHLKILTKILFYIFEISSGHTYFRDFCVLTYSEIVQETLQRIPPEVSPGILARIPSENSPRIAQKFIEGIFQEFHPLSEISARIIADIFFSQIPLK